MRKLIFFGLLLALSTSVHAGEKYRLRNNGDYDITDKYGNSKGRLRQDGQGGYWVEDNYGNTQGRVRKEHKGEYECQKKDRDDRHCTSRR